MNDRNLCYHHLAHPVFSDMMFVSAVSRKGNRCAQVYATDFGWASAFPMVSRSEAHEPYHCCLLGIKSHQLVYVVQEKFYQSLKDAACYLKQLEPYTPWSNAAKER